MTDSLNRRNFLKLAALTGVAAGTGCGPAPTRELISLAVPAEDSVPGVASWYATTCGECPAGCGMLVRTHEGRATKVEGNPQHPVSKGGLCMRGQAALQGLYNPDRFRGPLHRTAGGSLAPISWEEAETLLAERIEGLRAAGQQGRIAFLSGQNGETLDQLIRQWVAALGSPRYVVYEPFSYAPIQQAGAVAFGREWIPDYDPQASDYLLSFGADYLETWLNPVAWSHAYAAMRELRQGNIAKIVQVEPRLSLTGANADEWVAIRPGTELWMALAMAQHIVAGGLGPELPGADAARLRNMLEPYTPERAASITDVPQARIEALAEEFAAARFPIAIGGGVAVTGENATATQVAVHVLNYVSGGKGQTAPAGSFQESPPANGAAAALQGLIESMNRAEVEILFVHHSNPAFTLPPHLGFAAVLARVPMVVSFSSFPDETTEHAHLVLPDHTPLEQWGDARPAPGVRSLVQPAMNPVFNTRAAADVLLGVARLAGFADGAAQPAASFQEHLKERWRETYRGAAGESFEIFWREALQRGGVWETVASAPAGYLQQAVPAALPARLFAFEWPQPPLPAASEFLLHVYPSSRHYDGRGANRPWLQEIPDPITNVVWDSWVEVHPATAAHLGVGEGDLLRLESDAGAVEVPVYIYEGIRRDTVAIPIGLGHTSYGRYATGRGANPMALLPAMHDAHSGIQAWAGVRVRLSKTGGRRELVRTDGSLTDHGRGFSQVIPLATLAAPQEAAANEAAGAPEHPSLYPPHEHKDYRWGMAINLSSCTGCSACVAACYAENNVPVVGKELVAQGRHMAWIRIERYMENVSATPDIRFSPMMCQQCDNAPCEPVCPVYATVHSSDGLNLQVYNRCVGTRYCSNNCPYKVRVFNWFDYEFPEPLQLQLNPDVSVRGRGVMEKCTFCVQRIRVGKDRAKDEGRLVRDGEVAPACAQSCPTQAIVFGNLLDPESAVSRAAGTAHGYKVLEELNTLPAVTYLPRVKRM